MVYEKKASIFACDKAEVYCDVDVAIGGDEMVKKVEDAEKTLALCQENTCLCLDQHRIVPTDLELLGFK